MLAAVLDQPEGRSVPERGRSAVAEGDLVAVGQVEQPTEALTYPAYNRLDRRLAVARAHERAPRRGQRIQGLGAHLRGPGPESPVTRQHVGGDADIGNLVGGH